MQIGEHIYKAENQIKFAMLTGDYNPLHIDQIRARREMFGAIIVHGMHVVMNALQDYIDFNGWVEPKRLTRLKIGFSNAVYLGKKCRLFLVNETENTVKLKLTGDYGIDLLTIQFDWEERAPFNSRQRTTYPQQQSTPMELELNDLVSQSYELPKKINPELLTEMFPGFEKFLGANVAAELATLTRLVGMHCPGMQSIFSGFELINSASEVDTVNCKIDRIDNRFSLIFISTQSDCYKGKLECFYRPKPVRQSTYNECIETTTQDSFQNQIAWIIGGSRGIGEATAKIVAAGGGQSIVTYLQGRNEAEDIANEISSSGGKAMAMQFDYADPDSGIGFLGKVNIVPNVIYYFASPKIFSQKGVRYEHDLFLKFADFYLNGIISLYQAFRKYNKTSKLVIFNPSSSAIDTPVKGLIEYTAAKAAAEALIANLGQFDNNLEIVQARLPRIATDQTMTLVPYPAAKAEEAIYPLVQQITATISTFD